MNLFPSQSTETSKECFCSFVSILCHDKNLLFMNKIIVWEDKERFTEVRQGWGSRSTSQIFTYFMRTWKGWAIAWSHEIIFPSQWISWLRNLLRAKCIHSTQNCLKLKGNSLLPSFKMQSVYGVCALYVCVCGARLR